jgi:lysozyme family protein
MADFKNAFSFIMESEDPKYQYASVPDVGGFAISGINSASFPSQFAAIKAIPQAQRGPAVTNFYLTEFWNQWLAELNSDALSMRVFDAGVNMGAGTAVKILQTSINTLRSSAMVVDGGWGPLTVTAANKCDSIALVQAFKDARVAHYENIVLANPSDEKYLEEWKARAEK